MLVLGVLDLGRAYQLQIRLENAAREGAVFAQIHPNDVTCGASGNIVDRLLTEEPGLDERPGFAVAVLADDGSGLVPITGCGGEVAEPGERVRVEVTVTFEVLTPLVERAVGGAIDISGAAEVRVQG